MSHPLRRESDDQEKRRFRLFKQKQEDQKLSVEIDHVPTSAFNRDWRRRVMHTHRHQTMYDPFDELTAYGAKRLSKRRAAARRAKQARKVNR